MAAEARPPTNDWEDSAEQRPPHQARLAALWLDRQLLRLLNSRRWSTAMQKPVLKSVWSNLQTTRMPPATRAAVELLRSWLSGRRCPWSQLTRSFLPQKLSDKERNQAGHERQFATSSKSTKHQRA